jgi:1-deoxy-D-xylulose-5-phosphate synthase
MEYLSRINGPADLKKLDPEELPALAEEIRQKIIATVSHTGGHLATNLGAVELTIGLHYAFDLPNDKLVWDVSHQIYPHKLLTGRRDQFDTIRQYGGLAGFAKREESEYDCFGAGHASTSISAACGLAAARDAAGLDHRVVAIIGDGSLTGGLAYEGLNNAGTSRRDMLVVLNDNTWSISKNVGAISTYLTNIMADEKFNRLRNEVWELTGRFKRRDRIRRTIANLEHSINSLLVPGMVFQKLGFRYFGPIDGHDLPLLLRTLEKIKNLQGPLLLHVGTTKGKGCDFAECNPTRYHGVGAFDKITGKFAPKTAGRPSYTEVFGNTMVELGARDKRVMAITAAMASGTGLVKFSEEYPDRFFDVGIAEGHAGCMAAGLAAGGQRPYMAVYSTFMQRAYDQVIHDMALQKLPVVICMDRAGLVGDDGPTHHGVFDIAAMSAVPNLTFAAPKSGSEFRAMLHQTVDLDSGGPVAIRYPRAAVPDDIDDEVARIDWGTWEEVTPGGDVAVLAVGTMVETALKAAEDLDEKGIELWVINARFIKPWDHKMLHRVMDSTRAILTAEEGCLAGGFGQSIGRYLIESGYKGRFRALGIPDEFVTHGNRSLLLRDVGLDVHGLARSIAEVATGRDRGEPANLLKKLIFGKNGHRKRRRDQHAARAMVEENR